MMTKLDEIERRIKLIPESTMPIDKTDFELIVRGLKQLWKVARIDLYEDIVIDPDVLELLEEQE